MLCFCITRLECSTWNIEHYRTFFCITFHVEHVGVLAANFKRMFHVEHLHQNAALHSQITSHYSGPHS